MDFSKIAEILKATPVEVEDTWDKLQNGFMTPEISTDPGDPELGEGIFVRLSARGFLDSTDWDGPFDNVEEAAAHLIEVYGEDW